MATLSTTIKKIYFDAIVDGKKITEFKETSPFWRKRIDNKGLQLDSIVFICGRLVHKREIVMIQEVPTEEFLKHIIKTPTMYAIHLGAELPLNNKKQAV